MVCWNAQKFRPNAIKYNSIIRRRNICHTHTDERHIEHARYDFQRIHNDQITYNCRIVVIICVYTFVVFWLFFGCSFVYCVSLSFVHSAHNLLSFFSSLSNWLDRFLLIFALITANAFHFFLSLFIYHYFPPKQQKYERETNHLRCGRKLLASNYRKQKKKIVYTDRLNQYSTAPKSKRNQLKLKLGLRSSVHCKTPEVSQRPKSWYTFSR